MELGVNVYVFVCVHAWVCIYACMHTQCLEAFTWLILNPEAVLVDVQTRSPSSMRQGESNCPTRKTIDIDRLLA